MERGNDDRHFFPFSSSIGSVRSSRRCSLISWDHHQTTGLLSVGDGGADLEVLRRDIRLRVSMEEVLGGI